MIDRHTLEEVVEILESPIQIYNQNDGDEEECRACRRRWYVQGPKRTPQRHEEDCMLLRLMDVLSGVPGAAAADVAREWEKHEG